MMLRAVWLAVPVAVIFVGSVSAGPARYGSIRWQGEVAAEAILSVQGDQVTRRGSSAAGDQTRVAAPLPPSTSLAYVRSVRGNALVSIDEQPTASNNWTATVVIRTAAGARQEVEWELLWLETSAASVETGAAPGTAPPSEPAAAAPPTVEPPATATASLEPPSETFTWSGFVDGQEILVIQGRSVRLDHLSGRSARVDRERFSAPLPAGPALVQLRKTEGRGVAVIEQQPRADNGWTLRVRLEDPLGGEDYYRVELSWPRP